VLTPLRDHPITEFPPEPPLLALSLLVPFTAADTAISTKFTLAAAHLMAGAIIIPVVAWRLSQVR